MISQDKQKRMEYEAREKTIRDHNQMMFEAEERGEARKAIAIAKNLISFGMPSDTISQITGLSIEEIEKINIKS